MVRFNNYSMFVEERNGRDWYDWCVFVDEPWEVLETIKEVEYLLHPSFPKPHRIMDDAHMKFALFSSGWGFFIIRIKIIYKDSTLEETKYKLKLKHDDWPKEPLVQTNLDEDEEEIYSKIKASRYRWRKPATIAKKTNLSIREVEIKLLNLNEKGLIRKSSFRTFSDEELWGAVANVGISPKI